MTVTVRRALPEDAPFVHHLLCVIGAYHREGRPDLYREGLVKYDLETVRDKLARPGELSFIAVDGEGTPLGYLLTDIRETSGNVSFLDRRVLYIDDLCVDENARRGGVATALMDAAVDAARGLECDAVELNVMEFNESARRFYERYGMTTQKRQMELPLV